MTVTTDHLVIRRVKIASADRLCALVPGHFAIEGRPVGLAAPSDGAADPIGWACATCMNRLQIQPRPSADLISRPWRPGDLLVWYVATAQFRGVCRLDASHWREEGAKAGLVLRLAGDPPDLSTKDGHAQLGWCCCECLMGLISR